MCTTRTGGTLPCTSWQTSPALNMHLFEWAQPAHRLIVSCLPPDRVCTARVKEATCGGKRTPRYATHVTILRWKALLATVAASWVCRQAAGRGCGDWSDSSKLPGARGTRGRDGDQAPETSPEGRGLPPVPSDKNVSTESNVLPILFAQPLSTLARCCCSLMLSWYSPRSSGSSL